MHEMQFPMGNDNASIGLREIATAVSRTDWDWLFIEFYGVGLAPCNLSMVEFEQRVRSEGFRLSGHEFMKFAERVDQVWDCLLVTVDEADARSPKELERANFSGAHLVVEGFDSTNWTLKSPSDSLLRALATNLGVKRPYES